MALRHAHAATQSPRTSQVEIPYRPLIIPTASTALRTTSCVNNFLGDKLFEWDLGLNPPSSLTREAQLEAVHSKQLSLSSLYKAVSKNRLTGNLGRNCRGNAIARLKNKTLSGRSTCPPLSKNRP
eukprot:4159868-Amphidinium_carterae.1